MNIYSPQIGGESLQGSGLESAAFLTRADLITAAAQRATSALHLQIAYRAEPTASPAVAARISNAAMSAMHTEAGQTAAAYDVDEARALVEAAFASSAQPPAEEL